MAYMQEHFEWVKRIIESCQDGFQLEAAQTMVNLFEKRYGNNAEHDRLLSFLAAKQPMIMVV